MSLPPDPAAICFGLDRATDERSLGDFLRIFSSDPLLATLIPRLSDKEINALVDTLSVLLRTHLSEQEYHRLFLGEETH